MTKVTMFGFEQVPMTKVNEAVSCFACGYDIDNAVAIVNFEKVGLQTVCMKCKQKHSLLLTGENTLLTART